MSRDTRLGRSMIGAARRGSAMRAVVVGLLSSLVLVSPAMAVDIEVTTLADSLTVPNNDGFCSLREAIAAVEAPPVPVDTCQTGAPGLDRILFAPSLFPPGVPQTIFLLAELELRDRALEIIGPGARQLTISGQDTVRVFRVLPPADDLRTVSDITIANGHGLQNGGAIINVGGRLTVKNMSFVNNSANTDGGAISNEGAGAILTVLNSTFFGNRGIQGGVADTEQEEGGAIVNIDGTMTIANSTFVGNQVPNVDGNKGGAIHNSMTTDAHATIINSTFTGNSAPAGGAVFTERGGTIVLRNTLLAANPGGNCGLADPGSLIIDEGGNLDDGTSCGLTFGISVPNGIAGLDPAGLRDNGGLTGTDTIALTAASDAIDMGLPNHCAAAPVSNLDQRGVSRLIDGDGDGNVVCDVGAFESPLVSNQPPMVTNPGNQTSVVGANVNLAIRASDPDGDTLSYNATGLPVGLSINPGTGVVTGTLSAAGTSNVTVTVSDGQGGTTPVSFIWTVTSTTGPAPQCSGRTATVFVDSVSGLIVGGPDDGLFYNGRLRGTAGRDVMVGTAGRDIVLGFGGNDRICGRGGNDNIKGGAGNDRLFGQAGRDKLAGGPGLDRCNGGSGTNTFTGCE